MDNVTKSYDTEYKKEQKLQNLNNTEQFLIDLVEDGFEIETDSKDNTKIMYKSCRCLQYLVHAIQYRFQVKNDENTTHKT